MKAPMIQSRAVVRLPLVALLAACASENLQTTGLEPASSVNAATSGGPSSPSPSTASTSPDQPSTPMTQPARVDSDVPSSEGNPDDIAPPVLDPRDDGTGGQAPEDGAETPDPETPAGVPEVVLTPSQIGGDLEGFLHLAPCESQDFGHDCTLPGCQGGSKTLERTLQLGGAPGTIYDVTVHVYGVVEPRAYQGGVRRAGANFDASSLDLWYEGGVIPANPGTYNSYELHVEPGVPGAPNVYYLNSRTGGDQQIVVRIDYEATFPVPGGGTIRFRSFDLNCRQITNCASNECGPLNPKPLTVDAVRNADPPPVASFAQPYQTGANIGRGQWVYVDVLDAAPRP